MDRRRRDMLLSRWIGCIGLPEREVCMVRGRSGLRRGLIIVSLDAALLLMVYGN